MNILVISPFPFVPAHHGGQLRVKAMFDYFVGRGDHVQAIGVKSNWSYPDQGGFDPQPTKESVKSVYDGPSDMFSYGMGLLYGTDDTYYQSLAKKVTFVPDIVILEHPWLFDFTKRYISNLKKKPFLIFDAHNVEHILKKGILENVNLSHEIVKDCVDRIRLLEKSVAEFADLVVTVSYSDAKWFKSEVSTPVITVENGISDWDRNLVDCSLDLPNEFCLFCGSSHLPNKLGFFHFLGGTAFGSLNFDQRIIIAGAVGNSIERDRNLDRTACLREKLLIMGEIDDSMLTVLRNRAKVIILPIEFGGGTNLKTAEALLSGKYVVASRMAMRGYSKFENAPGVFIADSRADFKKMLRKAMSLPLLKLDAESVNERRKVLWSQCFVSLTNFLKQRGL